MVLALDIFGCSVFEGGEELGAAPRGRVPNGGY